MAVSFTTNIGLAKPDETEVAKNWAVTAELADDNNQIIEDETDVNLTAYVPTLTARVTPPNIGSAAIVNGEYQESGGFVWGTFSFIILNPGVSAGSGEYGVSLPFLVDNSFHSVGTALNDQTGTFSCIGEGYIRDDSSASNRGTVALDVVTVAGTSYARFVTETHSGKTSRVMSHTMPFAIANADSLSGIFFFKKA